MASKWMRGILVLSVIAGGISAAVVEGQTLDGQTPANEGVCDDLMWATPGLFGLCVAFCEAQDCEPDFAAADPFEDCRPSSRKLLDLYNRKKMPSDPEMPCVSQEACPCWSQNQLDGLRWPESDDTRACLSNSSTEQWTIIDDQFLYQTLVAAFELSGTAYCYVSNSCLPGDDACAPVVPAFFMDVTGEEFAACKEQVRSSRQDRNIDCS